MGFVGDAVDVVGDAVEDAAEAVGDAVDATVDAIADVVEASWDAIKATVDWTIDALTSDIGMMCLMAVATIAMVYPATVGPLSMYSGTTFAYADAVCTSIASFAEVIHLEVIMAVHSIAYVLSPDYRNMVRELTDSIGDLGEAIGTEREPMVMAFKNAETLVKDTAAIMGRSYDLADVTWLKTLKDYLRTGQSRIKEMENGLKDILPDIEENLIKPTLDNLSDFQRTRFKMFGDLAEVVDVGMDKVDSLFGSIDQLRFDLTKLNSDLPDVISDTVSPWISEINETFYNFKRDTYLPFKETTSNLINIIQGKQRQDRREIDGIVDRLLRPGDILKDIEDLGHDTRIDQENKVGEMASKSMEREAADLNEQAKASFEHLEKIRAALEEEIPAPEWKIPEHPKLTRPVGEQSKKADTWYVGDF